VATERALFTASLRSPVNLVVLVRLACPPLDDLLPGVLAALQQRHALLRARIVGGPVHPRFEVSPQAGAGVGGPGPIPVRLLHAGDDGSADAVVEAEMNAPFEAAAGPLARLTCLRGASGTTDLVLTVHHSIADGASTASLVHELLDWCGTRLGGDTPPVTVAAPVPPPLTALLPARMRGIQGLRRTLALAAREGRDELTYRRGSRGRRLPIPASGRALTCATGLDSSQTAALVDRSRRQRLTLTSLLTAGLLWQANAVLCRRRPTTMRVVIWVDLRPYLEPPVGDETLGCYVSMLRFPIRMDPERGFTALAADVQARIERGSRRGDRLPAALLSAPMTRLAVRWPVSRLGTVALSYAAAPAVRQSYGPLSIREVRAFVSNNRFGAEVAAACGVYGGALWCNLLYLSADYPETTAASLSDGLQATLHEFATQA
jgi:hypothetical protein